MARIFGQHGKYIVIHQKDGSFQNVVDSALIGMAYNKIKQQFQTTKHAILEHKGRRNINSRLMSAYIREGASANCLISSRQIGKSIWVSATKANAIINYLKKTGIVKINVPVYFKNIFSFNKRSIWNSERNVFGMQKILKGDIKALILCK